MAEEERPQKCPKLMYRIFATSWRRGELWVPCGRWNCDKCRRDRIVDITERVLECIPDGPVHDVTVGQMWPEAVRKSYRKRGLPYFGASLQTGGLYVISTHPAKGRAWRTVENEWEQFMTELPDRLFAMGIVGWHPSSAWRAERSPDEEPRDSYLFYGIIPGNDPRLLRRAAEAAGVTVNGYGPPSDPAAAIEALTQVLRPDASELPSANGKKVNLRELSKWNTIQKES